MSTATYPQTDLKPTGFYVPSGSQPYASFTKHSNGTGAIGGLKIFKSGTFKDSMGFQRTWEPEHLEQMIFHFGLLRDRGTFPNVPVRDGHPGLFGSGGTVVGYIESLKRDSDFLLADLEITEPEALAKWERGTFRARSLEVGMYESNDEATYWPVVMGLAFVDIPAVEGLYSRYSNPSRRPEKSKFHFAQTVLDDKETRMADAPNESTEQQPEATPPAPPAEPTNPQTAPTTPAPEEAPQQAPTAAPAQSNNSRDLNAASLFRINGQPASDFAAVQAHIDTLEGFARETRDQARRDYVTGLAQTNRIAATQIESLAAHALSLSDEQWNAFRAVYDTAPQVPLFGQRSDNGSGTPSPSAADKVADEIAVLEAQVAMHKRSGMPEEKIALTNSYKRLQALKSSGTAA